MTTRCNWYDRPVFPLELFGDVLTDVIRELQFDYYLDDWIEIEDKVIDMKLPKGEKVHSVDVGVRLAKIAGRPVVVDVDGIISRCHPSGKIENLSALMKEVSDEAKSNVPRK